MCRDAVTSSSLSVAAVSQHHVKFLYEVKFKLILSLNLRPNLAASYRPNLEAQLIIARISDR